jgi:penicillin amidase
MVTIEAASRADAHFALGFAHGQDRFFQMDLLRRNAAGELSALFGEATVAFDKRRRLHRMRTRAETVYRHLDAAERNAVQTYAMGVNAGLQSLKRRPYPYFVIRQQPEPWLPEDSILAGYAMFFDLQDEDARDEENRAFARQHLSSEVFAFLFRNGFAHSVPLVGEALPVNPPPSKEFWPAPAKEPLAALSALPSESIPGSNAWAAAGNRTASGVAQVAADLHLGLRVPNTWYRAQLTYPGEEGTVTVTGVTLPGAPGVIVGTNGKVAWGFTNAGADMSDLVRLQTDPEKPGMYRTVNGWKAFSEKEERIRVRGEDPVRHPVRETIFGPVRENRFGGGLWAVQWIGHHPEYFNLHHLQLAEAVSTEEATEIARRAGIPLQNFVVADQHGDIAWTFMGGMPERGDRSAKLPVGSRHPEAKWLGRLAPEKVPRRVNPASGLIWTANNPVYRGTGADKLLGEESYADDARARVILEALEGQDRPFEEADFLAIQLSDRSQLHDRWQERILAALTDDWIGENPRRAAFREALRTWDGHATVDSTAFPLLRLARSHIAGEVYPRLLPELFPEEGPQLQINSFRWDEPLYQLVTAGDPALCGPDNDWDGLIRQAVEKVLTELRKHDFTPGELNHGELNRLRVQHPLSRALPLLGRWLDMPPVELPGYSTTPRAQKPAFGASQRMVVQPGQENTAIFHMPTGQSGHVLSPFYRAGHENWVQGLPSPLLPGPQAYRLLLLPQD